MEHAKSSSTTLDMVVIGGGAAGFFGALAAASHAPGRRVEIWEKGHEVLSKVRISGGGRCNVTHDCHDPRTLAGYYPRGGRELVGPFHAWAPSDTVRWFLDRGVRLKTESDGRMFPVSDDSCTIIQCFEDQIHQHGIGVRTGCEVVGLSREAGGFRLRTRSGKEQVCRRLLLASGGLKGKGLQELIESLGHTVVPPVPSLFTFRIREPWLNALAGISLKSVSVECPAERLKAEGPLLITHRGLSGPGILKLSAWGARSLHDRGYRFECRINWCGTRREDEVREQLRKLQALHPRKLPSNTFMEGIPKRLWEALLERWMPSGLDKWSTISGRHIAELARQLTGTVLQVDGKDTNKEEFVTCGGVRNAEVGFKTMESRLVPGLYFAGEILDIDGITGGFNFQAAWTTSMLAGRAMAASLEGDAP